MAGPVRRTTTVRGRTAIADRSPRPPLKALSSACAACIRSTSPTAVTPTPTASPSRATTCAISITTHVPIRARRTTDHARRTLTASRTTATGRAARVRGSAVNTNPCTRNAVPLMTTAIQVTATRTRRYASKHRTSPSCTRHVIRTRNVRAGSATSLLGPPRASAAIPRSTAVYAARPMRTVHRWTATGARNAARMRRRTTASRARPTTSARPTTATTVSAARTGPTAADPRVIVRATITVTRKSISALSVKNRSPLRKKRCIKPVHRTKIAVLTTVAGENANRILSPAVKIQLIAKKDGTVNQN